jgi:hypothetical protein
MKMGKLKITKVKIKIEFLIILFLVIFIGNWVYRSHRLGYTPITQMNQSLCPISYSSLMCTDGAPTITFFNPEDKKITDIQIFTPKEGGTDIYNVIYPLYVYQMNNLTLNYTSCGISLEKIKMRWCCDKCYETYLDSPEDLLLANLSLQLSLQYSNLENCKKLESVERDSCYGEVAEMTNDITICELIHDPDFYSLCIAQLTLNSDECMKIRDTQLREACLDSVKMKKEWKGQ